VQLKKRDPSARWRNEVFVQVGDRIGIRFRTIDIGVLHRTALGCVCKIQTHPRRCARTPLQEGIFACGVLNPLSRGVPVRAGCVRDDVSRDNSRSNVLQTPQPDSRLGLGRLWTVPSGGLQGPCGSWCSERSARCSATRTAGRWRRRPRTARGGRWSWREWEVRGWLVHVLPASVLCQRSISKTPSMRRAGGRA